MLGEHPADRLDPGLVAVGVDDIRALIRPEYVGVDPVDRVVYQPGEITQCDLRLRPDLAPRDLAADSA